jgi:hypothetical protein
MLKENPTSLAARMRCHKRAKSMLCDLSLLETTTVAIGSLNKASAHNRSKSTQFTFASSVFDITAPTSPSTFVVVDMMPKSSAVMITPINTPVARVKRTRLCPKTSASARSWKESHPCMSPPLLVVYRTTVTLERVTQNGRSELPRHLLMPSLEDPVEDPLEDVELSTLLPRPRGPQTCMARRMPWRFTENDQDEDDEVATITARFHDDSTIFTPPF